MRCSINFGVNTMVCNTTVPHHSDRQSEERRRESKGQVIITIRNLLTLSITPHLQNSMKKLPVM